MEKEPKKDRTCTHNCSYICGECQIFEYKATLKQTAVEFFVDRLKELYIEIDAIQLEKLNDAFEKAKEIENQQQRYSEEDMESAWNSSEQNMRFQFSSSVYNNVKFEKWLEIYKKEKDMKQTEQQQQDNGDLVSLIWMIEKLRRREGGCTMNELIAEAKKNFEGIEQLKNK